MKNKIQFLILTFLILLWASCNSLISLQSEKEKYTIIQEAKGDINLDGISDLAIVSSKSNSEKGTITVFITDAKGRVSKKLSNANLTDEFMELYSQLPEVEIKNGELTVFYYGGMCHRESRNIVFKLDKELNDLFFHKLMMSEHNVCKDTEPVGSEITNAELRQIRFSEFKDNLD